MADDAVNLNMTSAKNKGTMVDGMTESSVSYLNACSPGIGKVARRSGWRSAVSSKAVVFGMTIIAAVVVLSIFAPIAFTVDPLSINPSAKFEAPSFEHWLGTDLYGRDIYSRTLYGGRTSLIVGFSVTVLAVGVGLCIGLVSGFFRSIDSVVMRVMDAFMAIPGILLAIALIAVNGASVGNVIMAIAIPEIPRVVRLVRAVVLSVREEPYVEAAVTSGTRLVPLLIRHVLPNTIAPLVVLSSFICASAIINEAALSFLGAGLPPEIPSWGSMISEGRTYFQIVPLMIFVPGLFLSATVLGVNILGDGLRDTLDPKMSKSI